MALTAERCEACRPGAPMVTEEEAQTLKRQIPDWEIVEINGERRLKRQFTFKGWMLAVQFTDAVARIAEEENHHPSMLLQWGKVTVTWWTHAIKGLHRNDFIMAAKTDEVYTQHFANGSNKGV
jgi:4a-hydroxytetrahydrobiopterin dehydratase